MGKFDKEKLVLGIINNETINETKKQNLLISFYEGMIGHSQDLEETHFGRFIFSNCESSYYVGYTGVNDKHGKGIVVKRG